MTPDPDAGPQALPDRACGSCTACCEWLRIDAPELDKPPGVLCGHACAGGGCAIYPRRPSPCRVWSCQWSVAATVPRAMRPDLCGVIVMETPVRTFSEPDIGYVLLAFWPVAMLPCTQIDTLLTTLLGRGLPVYLAVPGPPGEEAQSAPLNALVADLVGTGAPERLATALGHVAARLEGEVRERGLARPR